MADKLCKDCIFWQGNIYKFCLKKEELQAGDSLACESFKTKTDLDREQDIKFRNATKEAEKQLNPCPLCGGNVVITPEYGGLKPYDNLFVRCKKCELVMCERNGLDKLVEKWNTRAEK